MAHLLQCIRAKAAGIYTVGYDMQSLGWDGKFALPFAGGFLAHDNPMGNHGHGFFPEQKEAWESLEMAHHAVHAAQ